MKGQFALSLIALSASAVKLSSSTEGPSCSEKVGGMVPLFRRINKDGNNILSLQEWLYSMPTHIMVARGDASEPSEEQMKKWF